MPDLFSPLSVGGRTLANRIVRAPAPSGHAEASGFAGDALVAYYARRARGGVGLLLSEPLLAVRPDGPAAPHLGAYDDAFVPGLGQLVRAVSAHGASLLLSLEAPAALAHAADLAPAREALLLAAWRAHAAGADGVVLSAADDGLLHRLLSPRHNRRDDAFGGDLDGRLRLAREVIEGVRRWVGKRMLLGFRMLADELVPGGIELQEARGAAKRLSAAGVQLLDVAAPVAAPQVARFPGWALPLANSVKRITDVPVIGSGLLGDPLLADGAIRDGSVDLVMLRRALHDDADWPQRARERLAGSG